MMGVRIRRPDVFKIGRRSMVWICTYSPMSRTWAKDSQCGFKSFKSGAAKEIFRRLTIDGFGFDVEMLYVARKLKLTVQPVPVRMIDHRHRSRVRLIVDSFKMFANLFTVRWNDLQGKY